jgi:hypothetical protein
MKYRIVERPVINDDLKTLRRYYVVECKVLGLFWVALDRRDVNFFLTKSEAKNYIELLKQEAKKKKVVHYD